MACAGWNGGRVPLHCMTTALRGDSCPHAPQELSFKGQQLCLPEVYRCIVPCPLHDYGPLLTAVQASPSLQSILNTVTLSKLKAHHVTPLTQGKIPRVLMQSAAAPPTSHRSPPPLPLSPAATLPHCHETSAGHGTAGHSHTCSVAPGRSSSTKPMAGGWPSLGPRAGLVTPSPQPSKYP